MLIPKPRVLLTNSIDPELQPVLAHCHVVLAPDSSAATLLRLIGDAEGLVVRAQLPPTLFEHAPGCGRWSGTPSGWT